MPTGPHGQHRPATPTQAAVHAAQIAAGERQEHPVHAKKSIILDLTKKPKKSKK